MPITLVVRQAILSQNDLEKQTPVPHPYLGLGQSSCIPQIKCQSSFWFCSTLEYYPLYVRIVMRTAPTLMNFDVVILLTIISHSSALVLMQPEYRQMNCDVWNQYSQQPRYLVVKWTITSFLTCWFLNHHSKIDRATLSIFLVHISIDELGFCQVHAHFIISSCPEKQDCSRS